ncbi:hypothetical protein 1 [Hubei sobemo-like virus 24]|uniref:hypothetical protein 1 n=1 Tax=Hubei sobemo-like virus 24 TaxID=1923210 RepID=UPI0009097F26|nr:hypothetical protein 1 [Hubei sobemo-like virus 24]APG75924.1 hypothetical protein 1 [Hubei sobemo-like virus 24]
MTVEDFDEDRVDSWAYADQEMDYDRVLDFGDDSADEEYRFDDRDDDRDDRWSDDELDAYEDKYERNREKRDRAEERWDYLNDDRDDYVREALGISRMTPAQKNRLKSLLDRPLVVKGQAPGAPNVEHPPPTEELDLDEVVGNLVERVEHLEAELANLKGKLIPKKGAPPVKKPKKCVHCSEMLESIAAAAKHRREQHPEAYWAARNATENPGYKGESANGADFKVRVKTQAKPAFFRGGSRKTSKPSSVSSSTTSGSSSGSPSPQETRKSTNGQNQSDDRFDKFLQAIIGLASEMKQK